MLSVSISFLNRAVIVPEKETKDHELSGVVEAELYILLCKVLMTNTTLSVQSGLNMVVLSATPTLR